MKDFSQEIPKKTFDKHIKDKGYKIISEHLGFPVETVKQIIEKFKIYGI